MSDTRRVRLRRELIDEIKTVALRQLTNGGPQAVGLRAIARELGMSPSALYGYFDSLDALFTALITDGFNSLADAVDSAAASDVDRPLQDRMLAGLLAYREWALANPERFQLLYFSPLPDYEAPAEGPTMNASLRVSAVFLAILVEGWQQELIDEAVAAEPTLDTSSFAEEFGIDLTSDQLRVAVANWGEFHGLVSLEIAGHIDDKWVDPAALYEGAMRSMMRRHGFPEQSAE